MKHTYKPGDYVIYNADEDWYNEDTPALLLSLSGENVTIRVFDQDGSGNTISTEVSTDLNHIHPAITAPLKQKGIRKKA